MKHTPGPWFRKPGANDNGAIHGGPEGRGVASVHYQEDPERYEANVRVIAAAPELLSTLRDLAENLRFEELRDGSYPDLSAVDALLARIEGGESHE